MASVSLVKGTFGVKNGDHGWVEWGKQRPTFFFPLLNWFPVKLWVGKNCSRLLSSIVSLPSTSLISSHFLLPSSPVDPSSRNKLTLRICDYEAVPYKASLESYNNLWVVCYRWGGLASQRLIFPKSWGVWEPLVFHFSAPPKHCPSDKVRQTLEW